MDETRRDVDTQDFSTVPSRTSPSDVDTRMEGRSASTDDVTLRFGPGVPPRLAGVWREKKPRKRPVARRILSGLITLGVAILTGLVVWFLLRGGPKAEVTGVTVSAPAGVQACGATAVVVGVIHTNGGVGDVSYRWKRSDGQNSGVFTDSAPKGKHSIEVPLRWTVKGPGSLHAVATLEVISPKGPDGTASAAFDYECH
jgi:hypothetical protein